MNEQPTNPLAPTSEATPHNGATSTPPLIPTPEAPASDAAPSGSPIAPSHEATASGAASNAEATGESIGSIPFRSMVARGIIIGCAAGIVVASFRLTHDMLVPTIVGAFTATQHPFWGFLLWCVLATVIAWLVGRIVMKDSFISGSGIPNVELSLAGRAPFPWERILIDKFGASWLGLLGGLSIGREGPCIEMGAAMGRGLDALWGKASCIANASMIAGSAAGLSTAFGAPLAGVIFVFEEMKCLISSRMLILTATASFVAAAVMRYGFGIGIILPFQWFTPPPLREIWLLVVLGLIMGWLGVIYNRSLLRLKAAYDVQQHIPTVFKPLPPLLCAAVLLFLYPAILGGGDGLMARLDTGTYTYTALLLLMVSKFAFSLFSFSCGVPGGLLMPLLCIGSLVGVLISKFCAAYGLIDPSSMQSYIVFAMAGYFAAIVRAPLTGIILVTEMSGTYACLPGTLLVGYIANTVANAMHCPPIYDSLKERIAEALKKRDFGKGDDEHCT